MEIIATVGPSLMVPEKIQALVSAGVTIFRINGAHTEAGTAARLVAELRSFSGGRAKVMVDLPTNKVRTRNLSEPIVFEAGQRFRVYPVQLNYPELYRRVQVGDEALINNGYNRLRVTSVTGEVIEFQADSRGRLGNNRGLIFVRELHTPDFPFFFQRDLELIEVANDLGVDLVGLSYLRYPSDKQEARKRIRDAGSLVYKIETRVAFVNCERLIEAGEKIIIDRGDLAGEIGLVNIPQAQDRIIRWAHRYSVHVYLATQFLGAMEQYPVPRISEVCALYETIKVGVSGIQLSEETAVGAYPVEAVRWIREIEKLVCRGEQLDILAEPADGVTGAAVSAG